MQTTHPTVYDVDLADAMEESARAGDRRTFVELVRAADWSTRIPEELLKAIDLALYQEMARLAIELAQLGGDLFPDHERVQRAAQVLAPPVARVTRLPRAKGLDASKRGCVNMRTSIAASGWLFVREIC
ncbi:MAG: hypothetical protein MAG451_02388 [Anaerolineales bacterium]|nr:hypothetical protein [Anaerolineales bacterium]